MGNKFLGFMECVCLDNLMGLGLWQAQIQQMLRYTMLKALSALDAWQNVLIQQTHPPFGNFNLYKKV